MPRTPPPFASATHGPVHSRRARGWLLALVVSLVLWGLAIGAVAFVVSHVSHGVAVS